ncbi:MAG: carbonic anhydrase [bacterium]|nr:carbonic anhydrase [bacterium]
MVSAATALTHLKEGNRRFVSGAPTHPRRDDTRRAAQAERQTPFAAVLGCSDSRVPPEMLFDQGIGDLFVVRNAGNIADDVALGSIEYAARYLQVPLILVLGHERCGAVTAAVESVESGVQVGPHIDRLVDAITPAVAKARSESGGLLENAIRENVRAMVAKVASSAPVLAPLVQAGKVRVAGAVYGLKSGAVTWL